MNFDSDDEDYDAVENSLKTLSDDQCQDVLDGFTLLRLMHLSKRSSTFEKACDVQYRRRFRRIVTSFIKNVDEFSDVMDDTKTVISGSLTLLFIDPQFFAADFVGETHDMDLYTTASGVDSLVRYLVEEETYSLAGEEPSNAAREEYHFGSVSGIDRVIKLLKDGTRIDVVVSSGKHAFVPILHFHFTVPMNALGPAQFISFYPSYTLFRKGMYSDRAFYALTDSRGNRDVSRKAMQAAAKYVRKGFEILESPVMFGNHLKLCLTRRCRQIRYSDDLDTLRIDFRANLLDGCDKFILTENATIRWSLGGDLCGIVRSSRSRCPFFVQVL